MKRNYIQPATQVTETRTMNVLMASGEPSFSLTTTTTPLTWSMANAETGATANTAQ